MAQLEVGDLAVLSRPHCAEVAAQNAGRIGRVLGIITSYPGPCGCCLQPVAGPVIELEGWFGYWTLSQFERIPPLSESDYLSDKHDLLVPMEPA